MIVYMSIITECAYKGNPNYFRITTEILWPEKGNFLNQSQDREKGSGKPLEAGNRVNKVRIIGIGHFWSVNPEEINHSTTDPLASKTKK